MVAELGVSFSPIDPRMTEEELRTLLDRLYPAGRPKVERMPRPTIRGVKDLFEDILSMLPSEGRAPAAGLAPARGLAVERPSLSEVLAPQQPIAPEGPALEPTPAPAPEPAPEPTPAPAPEAAPETAPETAPESAQPEFSFGQPASEGGKWDSDYGAGKVTPDYGGGKWDSDYGAGKVAGDLTTKEGLESTSGGETEHELFQDLLGLVDLVDLVGNPIPW